MYLSLKIESKNPHLRVLWDPHRLEILLFPKAAWIQTQCNTLESPNKTDGVVYQSYLKDCFYSVKVLCNRKHYNIKTFNFVPVTRKLLLTLYSTLTLYCPLSAVAKQISHVWDNKGYLILTQLWFVLQIT